MMSVGVVAGKQIVSLSLAAYLFKTNRHELRMLDLEFCIELDQSSLASVGIFTVHQRNYSDSKPKESTLKIEAGRIKFFDRFTKKRERSSLLSTIHSMDPRMLLDSKF